MQREDGRQDADEQRPESQQRRRHDGPVEGERRRVLPHVIVKGLGRAAVRARPLALTLTLTIFARRRPPAVLIFRTSTTAVDLGLQWLRLVVVRVEVAMSMTLDELLCGSCIRTTPYFMGRFISLLPDSHRVDLVEGRQHRTKPFGHAARAGRIG